MKVTELQAEQHHLGEISDSVTLGWTSAESRESESRLEADDRLHRQNYPAEAAAAAIAARLAPKSAQRLRPWGTIALRTGPWLAAAALIVSVGAGPLLDQFSTERTKGSSSKLAVYRQSADGVTLLADGARASAGDRLQVEFVAPAHSWVLVFSVDGSGVLTTHYPDQGTRALQVAAGDNLIPQAYILDAAPKFERFYLVVGDHAFDRDDAWKSLREHPFERHLPTGLNVYPLTLTKEIP